MFQHFAFVLRKLLDLDSLEKAPFFIDIKNTYLIANLKVDYIQFNLHNGIFRDKDFMSFVALVVDVCSKHVSNSRYRVCHFTYRLNVLTYTHCLHSPWPVSLLILDIYFVLSVHAPIQHPNLNGNTPKGNRASLVLKYYASCVPVSSISYWTFVCSCINSFPNICAYKILLLMKLVAPYPLALTGGKWRDELLWERRYLFILSLFPLALTSHICLLPFQFQTAYEVCWGLNWKIVSPDFARKCEDYLEISEFQVDKEVGLCTCEEELFKHGGTFKNGKVFTGNITNRNWKLPWEVRWRQESASQQTEDWYARQEKDQLWRGFSSCLEMLHCILLCFVKRVWS